MLRLGEAILTDVDADGTNPANVFNAIYEIVVAEALEAGPELGWKFARWRASSIDVDSTSITAFADYSGTVTGTVKATSTAHGLVTNDLVTISAGSVGSYDGDETITRIDADNFYFTATFVATETATVSWTSQQFTYRYARPTSTAVTSVQFGGAELTDWIREGEWILTNQQATEVDMTYIRVLADLTVANFPPHFVDALWRRFAVHLAYDLVQNRVLSEQLLTELETIHLPRDIAMDARVQYVQEFNNDWQNVGHADGTKTGFNLPKLSASQTALSNIT